jgi:hypothetical protein
MVVMMPKLTNDLGIVSYLLYILPKDANEESSRLISAKLPLNMHNTTNHILESLQLARIKQ